MSESIIAYVRKREPNGIRWTDAEKEFCSDRKWSKGKFVNHWKKAKKALKTEKDPKTGRNRYHIKEQALQVAERAYYKSELSECNLHEIEIPFQQIQQSIEKSVENKRPMFLGLAEAETKKLWEDIQKEREKSKNQHETKTRISKLVEKVLRKQGQPLDASAREDFLSIAEGVDLFFEGPKRLAKQHELEAKIGLLKLASHTKINVLYAKGEPLPVLGEEDITNLLYMLARNVKSRIKKPWHVIATFHVPEEDYIQDQEERPTDTEGKT